MRVDGRWLVWTLWSHACCDHWQALISTFDQMCRTYFQRSSRNPWSALQPTRASIHSIMKCFAFSLYLECWPCLGVSTSLPRTQDSWKTFVSHSHGLHQVSFSRTHRLPWSYRGRNLSFPEWPGMIAWSFCSTCQPILGQTCLSYPRPTHWTLPYRQVTLFASCSVSWLPSSWCVCLFSWDLNWPSWALISSCVQLLTFFWTISQDCYRWGRRSHSHRWPFSYRDPLQITDLDDSSR